MKSIFAWGSLKWQTSCDSSAQKWKPGERQDSGQRRILRGLLIVLPHSDTFEIVNGRHPTVEFGLLSGRSARNFTPNSLHLDSDRHLAMITGPNMAGKSTLLRQMAIVAILAQAGSYVPADKARLGIIDAVFSRVGARDDLYMDRSTFMMEMHEQVVKANACSVTRG